MFLNISVVSTGCHQLRQTGQMAAHCGGTRVNFPTATLAPYSVWALPHNPGWILTSVMTLACLHSKVVLLCHWIQVFTTNLVELPKCVRHIPFSIHFLYLQARGECSWTKDGYWTLGGILGWSWRVLAFRLWRGCWHSFFFLGRQELMNCSFYLWPEDVV